MIENGDPDFIHKLILQITLKIYNKTITSGEELAQFLKSIAEERNLDYITFLKEVSAKSKTIQKQMQKMKPLN